MGDNESALAAYEHALALNPYQPEIQNKVTSLRYTVPGTGAKPITPQENAIDPNGKEMMAIQPDGSTTTK